MQTLTTTNNLTTAEAAAGGAVLGGMFGAFAVFGIAFFILMVVAMWKIFAKAGEPGWKAIIPIYNVYIYFKIAGMKNWFWALFIVEIAVSILSAFSNGAIITDQAGNVVSIQNPIFPILMLAAAIFEIVVAIMQCAKLSKAFGRGIGTTLGLIFLPNIFQLILAFGSAKYDKKFLKK